MTSAEEIPQGLKPILNLICQRAEALRHPKANPQAESSRSTRAHD